MTNYFVLQNFLILMLYCL